MSTNIEHHHPGDKIANEIKALHSGDSMEQVARDIYDMHRHNPGTFAKEMNRVNQAFHNNKELGFPNVNIVGTNGQDLITKSADGKDVQTHDAKNMNRFSEEHDTARKTSLAEPGKQGDKAGVEHKDSAQTIDQKADGSAKYDVKKGDNAWSIADKMLTHEGAITDKTDKHTKDNLIANYVKEAGLEHKKLQAGDKVDLPTVQKGGDHTSFAPERKQEEIAANIKKQNEENENLSKNIGRALNEIPSHNITAAMTLQTIDKSLADSHLSPDAKASLEFVKSHWDKLGEFKNDQGNIVHRSFDAGMKKRTDNVESMYKQMRSIGSDL